MRTRSLAALAAALVLLAACGTTSGDDPDGSATTDGAGSNTDADAPIRGVDGDTVKIGFVVITNQAEASAQAGADGITTIEQDAAIELLVEDLNDRGGLDGLTVEPVFFEIDATAAVDQQTIIRSYCATFTQDNEVYAVLAASEPGAEQLACLDEAGVPAIVAGGSTTFLDDAAYEAAPLLANVNGISLDTVATSLVEGLASAAWFEPGATVGVLRLQDDAFDTATAESLLPAFEAAGVEVTEEVAIASVQSQDDIGRVSTEAQAAVLRMKDAGVDHLVFFESGGALPFFFMSAAREQDFGPKLAFSSTSGGQTLVTNIQTGGAGIGWDPLIDVPFDAQATTERAQECFDLLDPTGAAFTTATARSQALSLCDVVWLLEAGTAEAGLSDGQGVIDSITSLGDSYSSASLERVTFGPDKRYGVAEYREVEYDPACGCNVYLDGEPTPVG